MALKERATTNEIKQVPEQKQGGEGAAMLLPHPLIPPDACAVCLRSGTSAELIRFNSSQCVCFH